MLHKNIGETFCYPNTKLNTQYPIRFIFKGKYPIPQKAYLYICMYLLHDSNLFLLLHMSVSFISVYYNVKGDAIKIQSKLLQYFITCQSHSTTFSLGLNNAIKRISSISCYFINLLSNSIMFNLFCLKAYMQCYINSCKIL